MEFNFTEEDLNDPLLLAEFEKLQKSVNDEGEETEDHLTLEELSKMERGESLLQSEIPSFSGSKDFQSLRNDLSTKIHFSPPKKEKKTTNENQKEKVTQMKKETTELALKYKKEGKVEEAKQEMLKIRKLKEFEIQIENGETVDFSQLSLLHSLPSPSALSSNPSTPIKANTNNINPMKMESTPVKEETNHNKLEEGQEERRNKTIGLLNEGLTKQYNEILKKYKEKKEKGEARDSSDLQLCKEIKADIDWLKIFSVSHPTQMPLYHYKTIDRIVIHSNDHLSDIQLECSIGDLHSIDSSLVSGSIYLFISFPYPSSESPQSFSTTSVSIAASVAKFGQNSKFKIERKKSTNGTFERKKLTIEIQQSK